MSLRYPSFLALAVLLVGCPRGPGDDTSGDDTSDDTADTNDTDTGSDTDTDTGGDTDTDTGTASIDCHTLPTSLPAWAGDIEPTTLVTNTPYTTTATGLADAIAAIAALTASSTASTLTNPIAITDAYVLSTGFKPSGATNEVNFYIADKDDVLYVRLATTASVVVKAGDKVNLTVTKGTNYFGDYQVSEITGFSVTSSGNPVYVKESNGKTLTAADDAFWVHHMYGELTDAGTACGGSSTCFSYKTGGASGTTNTFRIQNGNLSIPLVKGDCVEIYAPADQHEGGINLDISDFKWHRWYGNSGN